MLWRLIVITKKLYKHRRRTDGDERAYLKDALDLNLFVADAAAGCCDVAATTTLSQPLLFAIVVQIKTGHRTTHLTPPPIGDNYIVDRLR